MHVVQDRDEWQDIVKMVMKNCIPKKKKRGIS
jgi:hypothetical protein